MKTKISLLIICRKGDPLLKNCLHSARHLADEVIIIDDDLENLGRKRLKGIKKTKNDWVLVLDTDEVISDSLKSEIRSKIKNKQNIREKGYLIPFQNHFLGRPVAYGGENYKMLRLFNKYNVEIKPALVHEGFKLKNGIPGELKNKIHHYSYRSIPQMFRKFTDYAVREARQKITAGEKPSYLKIFSYPLHMFWARFFKDRGYKDGLFRIPLDLGFAYMEMMTYVLLFLYGQKSSVNTGKNKSTI